MSYQTEEGIPMLANPENSTTMARKKNPVFLATLLVLGLAVSSFIAGTVYSSSAVASLSFDCDHLIEMVEVECGAYMADCVKNGVTCIDGTEGHFCMQDLFVGDHYGCFVLKR